MTSTPQKTAITCLDHAVLAIECDVKGRGDEGGQCNFFLDPFSSLPRPASPVSSS